MKYRCGHCRCELIYEREIDDGYCDRCMDILIERSQQARDWAEFHDEPCPKEELTPLPPPPEDEAR